jgi:hypothetical protein
MRYRIDRTDEGDALELLVRSPAAHLEFPSVYKARSPPGPCPSQSPRSLISSRTANPLRKHTASSSRKTVRRLWSQGANLGLRRMRISAALGRTFSRALFPRDGMKGQFVPGKDANCDGVIGGLVR